jgi:hypothetical protein
LGIEWKIEKTFIIRGDFVCLLGEIFVKKMKKGGEILQ